jgi:hypothetical protein
MHYYLDNDESTVSLSCPQIGSTTVYFDAYQEPIVTPDPDAVHPLVKAFGAS